MVPWACLRALVIVQIFEIGIDDIVVTFGCIRSRGNVFVFVLSRLVDGFAQFHRRFGNVLDTVVDLINIVGRQAAWRSPKDRDMDKLTDMVRGVADLGLETCMTLGMLSPEQVTKLKDAGLDFYNHNIDTSPEYYAEIASTRTMEDRLETVEHVRKGGIKVCCGGILGMGEAEADRISMLVTLATLPSHPDSVPVNLWNAVKGVPVQGKSEKVDPFALVRLVALARILMPASVVRLSAGRTGMSDELQSLCFLAGANSIFVGNQLLTTENPATWKDNDLLQRLGMHVAPAKPASRSAKIAAQ